MVNNSTNITKTNNHLSPKESLDSDGQHNDKRRPQHMMLEIQVLAWDRYKNVVVLNWLMRMVHNHLW